MREWIVEQVVKLTDGEVCVKVCGGYMMVLVEQFHDFLAAKLYVNEALALAAALVHVASQTSQSSPLAQARLKAEFADKLWREAWNETIEASGAGADEKGMLAQRLKEFLASLNEEAESC